jgi:hypothetical protein
MHVSTSDHHAHAQLRLEALSLRLVLPMCALVPSFHAARDKQRSQQLQRSTTIVSSLAQANRHGSLRWAWCLSCYVRRP